MYLPNKVKGFTLIELMVAISIIAVLSTIGMVAYSKVQLLGRDARRKQDLRAIAQALEIFYQQNKRYPCNNTTWSSWSYSTDSDPWLKDLNTCTGGSTINLTPDYLNKLPVDPINSGSPLATGTGYGYAYYSGDYRAETGSLSCPSGTGSSYTLVARLENTQDADTISNAKTKICTGGYYYTNAVYRPEDFIITSSGG